MTAEPAELMRRNLLDVFNERDAERRAAAIAEIYTEDVIWYEPDRVIHGRLDLAERATALQADMPPDWVFRPAGRASANADVGHLAFHLGPPGQPPAVTGMDIARCVDGRIAALYTFIDPPE